jgi:hypothetical protein
MRLAWRLAILLACFQSLILLGGCGRYGTPDLSASDKLMNGSLVNFLNSEIARNGGSTGLLRTTNGPLNGSWRFRSDANGAQIFTDAKFFGEIDQLLRDSLGKPDIANENEPGRYFAAYNVRRAGVGIQYRTAPSPFENVPNPLLHIIILKKGSLF